MYKIYFLMLLLLTSCSGSKSTNNKSVDNSLPSKLTAAERQNLINILNASFSRFESVIFGLSEAQLLFKSNQKKWSVSECIEHVALAELHFQEILEEAMKKPSNPAFRKKIKIKDEKIRPKMLSKIWKAKSPEVFKPSGKFKNPKDAIIAFSEQRLKTIEYIKTTQDDLRNHFWKHPLTGNIDLYQTLLLMSAHLERHLNQIENIKSNPNFPIG
jgi:hypothetical protein